MLTYTDDCLFTSDYSEEIDRMRTQLLGKYEGRDLGAPEKLGVAVRVDETGTTLHQQRYAQNIIIDGMGSMDVRTPSSPLDPGMDLTARQNNEEELDTNRCPYANILGKLMFLAGMTRPDLHNRVRELGRPAASPCLRHWHGLQNMLRYLSETMNIGLHYPERTRLVTGYADSDWANDSETPRSVTPYLSLFNGSPIICRSKLQGAITLSCSEAEWTAMAHGMRYCIVIRGILAEMGILQAVTVWYGDNRDALQAAAITDFNGRIKYVDTKLKCTGEYIGRGLFDVQFVPTTRQLADIFTKRLRKP
ncbi:unnamed protein product, partial [Discosporangium mesarthrocarpum]